ncbi:hypothetical protein [Persicitalea jodogahamensis]|uniref:Lipoprotein n=1 Tax=Persicitalea jodogahamensis TaxID=402147 RepID=A0A8J3GAR8_9BACT|nr:hypothetical protein [Persicitalea jodogahamensis]GHB85196.1 hypothetical protein GCM10007390_45640 [Persicitalea jodogahamensis]
MKSKLLITLMSALLFSQCSVDRGFVPKVDEQTRIEYLTKLVPHITGTFDMRKVQIKRQNITPLAEFKLDRDTTLTDFATLTLALAPVQYGSEPKQYEGEVRYKAKKYPVRFDLITGPWLYNQKGKGSKAYFLVQYNYPVGTSHLVEDEERFLEQIGLVSGNFSLETMSGPMIWKGSERAIEQIDFVRR